MTAIKYPYSEETARAVLERIEDGETLSDICKAMKVLRRTIQTWNRNDDNKVGDITFREALLRSRQEQMWTWADEIVEICNVKLEGDRKDPSKVQLARLQVDTKKFLMAKIASTVFGDKNLGGSEPITVRIVNFTEKKEVECPSPKE